MSKPYPTDILRRLRIAVSAWKHIDPGLKIGSLTVSEYETTLARAEAIQREICNAEAHLTELRDQRDQVYSQSWNYIVRLRAGIKGIYGDDSSQYEVVGGTRRRDRKPRSRGRKSQPGEALQAESGTG